MVAGIPEISDFLSKLETRLEKLELAVAGLPVVSVPEQKPEYKGKKPMDD